MQEIDNKTAAQQPQQHSEKSAKNDRSFISLGHTLHNELTYRGVNLFANSTVGVGFAFLVDHTKFGEQHLAPVLTYPFKKLMPLLTSNEKYIANGVKGGGMFTSIMVGGTAIIPVMAWLENTENKKAVIQGIDNVVYGKEAVAKDPKFAACYESVEHEPKKDFTTGMIARFAALTPLLALTMHKPSKDFLQENVYNHIGRCTKWMAEKMHIKPQSMINDVRTEINAKGVAEDINSWDYLHNRLIGFDFGLTAAYSVLHEITFKSLAAFRHGEDESKPDTRKERPDAAKPATISKPFADEKPLKLFTTAITPSSIKPMARQGDFTANLKVKPEPGLSPAL